MSAITDTERAAGVSTEAPALTNTERIVEEVAGDGYMEVNVPQKTEREGSYFFRVYTRFHSEIRVAGDPKGQTRVVRNDHLADYGLEVPEEFRK